LGGVGCGCGVGVGGGVIIKIRRYLSATTRLRNIFVTQIGCTDPWRYRGIIRWRGRGGLARGRG
jgi:hypothetical protein